MMKGNEALDRKVHTLRGEVECIRAEKIDLVSLRAATINPSELDCQREG